MKRMESALRLTTVLLLACITAGCSSDMLWSKPDGTADQFSADSAACFAKTHPDPNNPPYALESWHVPVYQSCMVSKGYTLDAYTAKFIPMTSRFAAPADPQAASR